MKPHFSTHSIFRAWCYLDDGASQSATDHDDPSRHPRTSPPAHAQSPNRDLGHPLLRDRPQHGRLHQHRLDPGSGHSQAGKMCVDHAGKKQDRQRQVRRNVQLIRDFTSGTYYHSRGCLVNRLKVDETGNLAWQNNWKISQSWSSFFSHFRWLSVVNEFYAPGWLHVR